LTESLKEGEVFVVHTHPIMRSSPRHFTKDLEMAGKNVEAVVDWNGQVTFYSKSGIMNPRGPDGILQPMRAYEAGFVDRDEKIIGFAKIDIIESAAGTVIKVVPR
jgi:hypothetical protein